MNNTMNQLLPDELIDLLAGSITPIEPPDRAGLRKRLLDRVHQGAEFVTVRASDEGWIKLSSKLDLKILHRDGDIDTYLVRLQPGAWLAAHAHPVAEECYVLEGSTVLEGQLIKAGDFHVAPPGRDHSRIFSETGCLLYIRGKAPDLPAQR